MFIHKDCELPKLKRITNPDGSRLYETPTGNSYPSVTTVTGLLKKKAILEWRKEIGEDKANEISKKAANRGTRIHRLCEKYLSNEEVDPGYFDKDMWDSFKDRLHDINNIYVLEESLYSDYLQVAGTVDCVAEYEGKLSVIDFKTSRRKKQREDIHDYFMQCAAYAVAFEERTEIPVSQLVIMMAIEDDEPEIFVEKRDRWIDGFINLREEYRQWKNI